MNAELHDAWRRFRDDDDAFVLVITGTGDAFCAGWDLQDAAEIELGDWDDFRTHLHTSPGECGYTRTADVFKPVIAAVERLGRGGRAWRTRCWPTSGSWPRTPCSERSSGAGTSSRATG